MTSLITRLEDPNCLCSLRHRTKTTQLIAADVMGLVPEKKPLDTSEHAYNWGLKNEGFNEAIDQVVRGLTEYLGVSDSSVTPEKACPCANQKNEWCPCNGDNGAEIHRQFFGHCTVCGGQLDTITFKDSKPPRSKS